MTFVEQKFIEAEAQMRSGNALGAATAYNDAVLESVLLVTGAPAPVAFELAMASETAATINMEKIMTQKWIALFIQVETYSDWRRTGIPSLTDNPNAATSIPVRLPTVRDERLYNANAVVVSDVELPVYFDQ